MIKNGSHSVKNHPVTWQHWCNMQIILDGKQIIYPASADGVERVYLQKVHTCPSLFFYICYNSKHNQTSRFVYNCAVFIQEVSLKSRSLLHGRSDKYYLKYKQVELLSPPEEWESLLQFILQFIGCIVRKKMTWWKMTWQDLLSHPKTSFKSFTLQC